MKHTSLFIRASGGRRQPSKRSVSLYNTTDLALIGLGLLAFLAAHKL